MFTALSYTTTKDENCLMLTKVQFTDKVAQRIKELREQKGMSQEELAHRANLYRTYVGHIETKRYSPSGYVIYKIAKALGVTPDELLKSL